MTAEPDIRKQDSWEEKSSPLASVTEEGLLLVKYRSYARDKVVREVMLPIAVDDKVMVAYWPKKKGIETVRLKDIVNTQPIKVF